MLFYFFVGQWNITNKAACPPLPLVAAGMQRNKKKWREAQQQRGEEVMAGEREKKRKGERGGDGQSWRRERGLQQNASVSSKTSLGPLQRVCSHVCTLVCFCPVGINTLQSHCVLRWTPPWRPVSSKRTRLLHPPSLSPLLSSVTSPSNLPFILLCKLSLSTPPFIHPFVNDSGRTDTTLTTPPPPFHHLCVPCFSPPGYPPECPHFLSPLQSTVS